VRSLLLKLIVRRDASAGEGMFYDLGDWLRWLARALVLAEPRLFKESLLLLAVGFRTLRLLLALAFYRIPID
jgi:hypothetical protein